MKWTGIRPLIMHNGLMADPTNPYTVAIKRITSKGSKKMTDSDHEERNRLEWEAGLYWDDELGAVVPNDNIERTIQMGGMKSRIGKDIQAAVLVQDDIVKVNYDGPRTKDKMYADPKFQIRKGVAVQKARIIRVRPMIPTGWNITFTVEYDDTVVNAKSIQKACEDAGALVGFCDWRPKFGRFHVEIL